MYSLTSCNIQPLHGSMSRLPKCGRSPKIKVNSNSFVNNFETKKFNPPKNFDPLPSRNPHEKIFSPPRPENKNQFHKKNIPSP